jgi:hypothetical protein
VGLEWDSLSLMRITEELHKIRGFHGGDYEEFLQELYGLTSQKTAFFN